MIILIYSMCAMVLVMSFIISSMARYRDKLLGVLDEAGMATVRFRFDVKTPKISLDRTIEDDISDPSNRYFTHNQIAHSRLIRTIGSTDDQLLKITEVVKAMYYGKVPFYVTEGNQGNGKWTHKMYYYDRDFTTSQVTVYKMENGIREIITDKNHEGWVKFEEMESGTGGWEAGRLNEVSHE